MRFQDLTIKSKVLLFSVITVVILMAGVLAVTTSLTESGVTNSVSPFLEMASHVAAEAVVAGLQLEDKDEVASAMSAFADQKLFTYLQVQDSNGKEVFVYREEGRPDLRNTDLESDEDHEGEIFDSTTVESDGTEIGKIVVGTSLELMDEAVSTARNATLLLAVAMIGVFVTVIGYYLRSVVQRPLEQTVKVLEGVAGGDLTQRLEVDSRDEIGQMGAALNKTVTTLQDARVEIARVYSMVENTAVAMILGGEDLSVQALNPAAKQIFKGIERHLPCSADKMIGKSVDDLFRNAVEARRILSDPRNLPYRGEIQIGPEDLGFVVTATTDKEGRYLGPMVTFETITERLATEQREKESAERERTRNEQERRQQQELREKVDSILETVTAAASGDLTAEVHIEGDDAPGRMAQGLKAFLEQLRSSMLRITDSAESLTAASNQLGAVSSRMVENAGRTSTQSEAVSEAGNLVSKNVEMVAGGTAQLSDSIREISNNTTAATRVTSDAVGTVESANEKIKRLGDSSAEVGKVINVITSIAEQTNLLALNATIEAARAGEAGKGFAVVANEVKELAKQTSQATEDIGHKIEAIQVDTEGAVGGISQVTDVINQINEIATTIASAVEEQTATTTEISRNVGDASRSTTEISSNISVVASSAQNTAQGAKETLDAAQALSQVAAQLQEVVDQFKV